MFKEHRHPALADTRAYLHRIGELEATLGFDAFGDRRDDVQLAWYYDNLGALVAHDVIDVDPVAGYLGGAMTDIWRILEPFVATERMRRSASPDAGRWQQYFENLVVLVRETGPDSARKRQRRWRLAA